MTHDRRTPPLPPVVWMGPIYQPTGFADEVRNYVVQLSRLGIPVVARSASPREGTFREHVAPEDRERIDRALARPIPHEFINEFIAIVHGPTSAVRPIREAAYTVARTMYETDGVAPAHVGWCNQLDEVWLPTDHSIEAFRRSGVTAHVTKIPEGIDCAKFRPGLAPLTIAGVRGSVFLSIFEWSYRKGWDVLLSAWAKAFSPNDDVTLVLRTYPFGAAPDDPRSRAVIEERIDTYLLSAHGLSRRDVAPIVVLGSAVPESELPRLYAAATAYVAPSRGEGWGRPQMEAMATGLPVIATRWSGPTEFMTDDTGLFLDFDLVPIDDRAEPHIARGHHWADPKAAHLVALMQRVVANRGEMARIGAGARSLVETSWRWDQAGQLVADRLGEIARLLALRSRPIAPNVDVPAVRWEGSQFAWHGLAHVNRELCRAIVASKRFDLEVIPHEPDEFRPGIASPFSELARRVNRPLGRPARVHVRHTCPPDFTPPKEGAWVMIQPWEFGGIPGGWVAPMRDMVDEIWVPSTWLRACYAASGVPVEKIVVIPNGVDTEFYRPEGQTFPLATKKRFKFLFLGGTITRKGIDLLIDTYFSSFTGADDVCLVVKGFGSGSVHGNSAIHQAIQNLAERSRQDPRMPALEYISESLSDEEIACLYRSCDAFVAPYRGEGFGLPIAEAMASGLPVIVTGYGAAMDFCDETTAYLIPAERAKAQVDGQIPNPLGFFWAEPEPKGLASHMRHAMSHPDEGRAMGVRGRARIVERLQWSHASAFVDERLSALATREPVRLVPPDDFQPDVPPLALDGKRGTAFFHHPNWSTGSWRGVVAGYLKAFRKGDDVTLVLWLDLRQGFTLEAISRELEGLIAESGGSADETPDLLLVPDDFTLRQLAQLYSAIDCVVSGGDPIQEGRALRMKKRRLSGFEDARALLPRSARSL